MMNDRPGDDLKRSMRRDLLWIGIVTLLVGVKLVLSYFFPALKTRGELLLSGGLLLVYTIRIFGMRSKLGH
jgi:hypothetical protein